MSTAAGELNQGGNYYALEDSSDESQQLEISEIKYGLSDRVAKEGDKVRIKYQHYSKVKHYGGPLELTLGGQHTYGRGFDYGIRGMKMEGTRELKIPPQLCPQNMPRSWRKMLGLRSREKKEIFRVNLLAIWDPSPTLELIQEQGVERQHKIE